MSVTVASRREFLLAATAGAALAAWPLRAQERPRFADMHAHMNFPRGAASFREFMARGNMLIVAEKAVPDGPFLRLIGDRLRPARDARPGELRRSFDVQFGRIRERMRAEGLGEVASVAALERAVAAGTPSLVLASEGADFLEGDAGYLEKVRADGLAMLQLVHYRVSDVGDISTEDAKHGGLTAFGKDVVRACNKLGILVDVAHGTSAGIEQALETSSKPVVYSHGHVTQNAPSYLQSGIAARAIHAPLAKRLAEKGGVIGLWPLWSQFANVEVYSNELARMADAFGARHVGVGSDMFGLLPRSAMPSYAEYAELPGYLGKRGMKPEEIEAVLGDNFLRVLRETLS
jgi:membrane dipeptidase